MVYIFFYNKLTNLDLINKINIQHDIYDGIIDVKNYDKENYLLEISDKKEENNVILFGKIVYFDMNIYDIIKKINNIEEIYIKNKETYILTLINAFKTNKELCPSYIIY